MRKAIFEYIELSKTEKQELWDNAIFVFDTNMYLNLYRYSKRTSDKIIGAMEALKERTWMPHRVAQEFMKNRVKVIFETKHNYDRIRNNANAFVEECKKTLNIKAIDDNTSITKLQEHLSTWINDYQKDNLVVTELSNDTLLERILDLYEDKVGIAFNDVELNNLYKEGDSRYKDKTPPGYKDIDKQDNDEKYGDLIVWKQVLNYAQKEKKNIIFITNDVKEDWWEIVNGKKLGPRVELKREFHDQTGMKFYMYNDVQFITLFQENNREPIDENVVNEMETFSENYDLPMEQKKLFYKTILNQSYEKELEKQIDELSNLIETYENELNRISTSKRKREDRIQEIDKLIEASKYQKSSAYESIYNELFDVLHKYNLDSVTEESIMERLEEAREKLELLRKKRNAIVHNYEICEFEL